MILVTLGTQDKEFKRLLKAIDTEIKNNNIKEKVIVQAGYTKYKSKNMEIFDLISQEELEKLVKECRILITHGGVGSILMGLQNNKPIIAAARLKKYKEHTNNHQKQIINEFKNRGYLLELEDFNKLGELLKEIENFKPNKFISNTKKFTNNIEKYINEDNHTSWFNKYRELTTHGYRGFLITLINIIIFNILISKYTLINSILISFFTTIFINLLINFLNDIKYNIVDYIIVNSCSLLLEIVFMYIAYQKLNFNLLFSKVIISFLIMIFNYIIIKYCFKRKKN